MPNAAAPPHFLPLPLSPQARLGGRTPVSRLRHTASEGLCVPRRAAIIAAMTASDAFCVHRRTSILAAGYLRLHMLLCVRLPLRVMF